MGISRGGDIILILALSGKASPSFQTEDLGSLLNSNHISPIDRPLFVGLEVLEDLGDG
jgi:hypothetical protein